MKFIFLSTILASLLLPIQLRAERNIYMDICNHAEYLECMDTSSGECIAANKKAVAICTEKHPLKGGNDRFTVAKQYGTCVMESYLTDLDADTTKYEKCAVHLSAIYSKYHQDALIEYQELDKRFFEEDDPLHNYSK